MPWPGAACEGQFNPIYGESMNPDKESEFSEPDCSPHPFDLMAIYALYQTVP